MKGVPTMEPDRYQVFFDGNKQHRYFATRLELLRFVLAMALKAEIPRFEVWVDAGSVTLANGRQLGRRFAPAEVWDLRDGALYDRLLDELAELQAAAAAPGR